MIRVIGIHGGDIYRNRVEIDFSVNVNPLGIPETVKAALHEEVNHCGKYPDPSAEKLKKAVSGMLCVPEECLLFGNGASELFMAAVHGIRPAKTVIPVPSFYGYEYVTEAAGGAVVYYETREKDNFCIGEDFFSALTEDVELLFAANPNNPTGALLETEYLEKLLCRCKDKGIIVVLDECFIEFCGGKQSFLRKTEEFSNLIVVRSFTKIFAIPGVRLGYLVCRNPSLLGKISRQLPEWNLSGFAQAAGCACTSETAYVRETAKYIKEEREFLEDGLKQLGIRVYPGKANFLLIHSEKSLYDRLLEKGILIRDCANFKGLSKGFYRIAVKSRRENGILLKAIGEMILS